MFFSNFYFFFPYCFHIYLYLKKSWQVFLKNQAWKKKRFRLISFLSFIPRLIVRQLQLDTLYMLAHMLTPVHARKKSVHANDPAGGLRISFSFGFLIGQPYSSRSSFLSIPYSLPPYIFPWALFLYTAFSDRRVFFIALGVPLEPTMTGACVPYAI